ncbi:carbohydrate ABC transporter permease [Pararhizobium sp. IMCC21322]|uniref:carbohydrate ABC transporter permease n=1 Tax=Pararhizobium sp. IMCC21322 TaxID=3067903 RepID=UPI002740E829|nr:carbohydrate ABC transporter permease [Pararhizobium sp. IMCC21322]
MAERYLTIALRVFIIGLGVIWSAFPIFMVVSSSFKTHIDIFAVPSKFLFTPTLDNYRQLFRAWPEFLDGLLNSLIVTTGATLLTAIVSLLAGYAYSRYQSRLLTASAFFMILVRMLPPLVVTIPLFPVINWLELNDTHAILIVLYAAFFVSLSTWILKAFIDQIPRELEEAAEVEGASLIQRLTKVILPLSVHGMVAACVFVVVFSWNEYMFALIFTSSAAKTAPLVLAEISGSLEGVQWGVLFAAATLQLAPVLIFVLLVQKYIVTGLTAGAVKG